MSEGWNRGPTIGWWDKMYPQSCFAQIKLLRNVFEWTLYDQTKIIRPDGEDYLDIVELIRGKTNSLEEAQRLADEAYIDAVVNP